MTGDSGTTATSDAAGVVLEATLAAERLGILATLIRLTGDWELAEDSLHDAVERALLTWPRDGVPDRPGGWLTTTARNRALDVLRRHATEARKLAELAWESALEPPDAGPSRGSHGLSHGPPHGLSHGPPHDLSHGPPHGLSHGPPRPFDDDRLRLIFTCCHPALPLEARVALTLRTVAGLDTPAAARAFLVSEATMSQRLLRARKKITHAGIPYAVPGKTQLNDRVDGVLAVVYLLFTTGYNAAADQPETAALADEAIRIAELLTTLLPHDPEVHALSALLLLQHARRHARYDGTGAPVTLDLQDRSRWSAEEIQRGVGALGRSQRLDAVPGAYRLQAAIAAEHVLAPTAADTDWPAIVGLYDLLLLAQPSPVVALNRAVALAMADGPDAGLAAIEGIGGLDSLASYFPLAATRAELLSRAGRVAEAVAETGRALTLADTAAEKHLLEERLARLRSASPG